MKKKLAKFGRSYRASGTRHVATKRLLARRQTLRRPKPPWHECLTRPYMVAAAARLAIVLPSRDVWLESVVARMHSTCSVKIYRCPSY